MHFYTDFPVADCARQAAFLKQAEDHGYDGIFGTENRQSPILPIAASAHRQQRLTVGTGVLAALAHNPFVLAQMAWDIHYNSGENFILGVGTHQDIHLDHRLGVGSQNKRERLVVAINAIREIWASWHEEREPCYESPYFSIRVCPAGFRPPSRLKTLPQIYVLCAEEGDVPAISKVADGVFLHPMWTTAFIEAEVASELSNVGSDLKSLAPSTLTAPVISGRVIATGETESAWTASRAQARLRVAGYWSQTKYDHVFEASGCLHHVQEFRGRIAHAPAAWEDHAIWESETVAELYRLFVCDADYNNLASTLASGLPECVTGAFPNVMSAIPRLLPLKIVQDIKRIKTGAVLSPTETDCFRNVV
jgi:alkanesulfonate monooxygenase SsuD/methylene tetrahydromethanopterin reductase-like flavin-dependent oxidoreductase (luciferase family)